LVRNRAYSHSMERDGYDNEAIMKHYRAILDQYDSAVDVLVLDQTHNGGGSYCEEFFSLFIQDEKNGFVQKCNADRRWVRGFKDWAEAGEGFMKVDEQLRQSYLENSTKVEQAIDRGDGLTEALPLMRYRQSRPDKFYTWKKPMLVLTDELAGSCGDAFPMLIKNNKVAKIFGERTMGLSGNVEIAAELNHSGIKARLTRGLFTTYDPTGVYPKELFIENNGVAPDYPYQFDISDARNGFVKYLEAVSNTAIEQIK